MRLIANRNGWNSRSDPIPLFSGLTPISEFRYAVFTRRGVAFRGMAVNPENIPGQPGSARRFQAGRCKRDLGYRTGAEMSRTHPRRFFRHGLLPQLLVFEAVARLGSVTRAAGELHLAQPTVSLQLKKLAATLEVTLFEQQGRSLRLTGAGHTLHETCGELIHCLIRADAKLAAFRQAKAERLRLAVEPEVRAAAARLIAGFCARHPGVQATLHVGEREERSEEHTSELQSR